MLKQLFAAMNDLLDDIIRYYPKADGELRTKLDEQICHLRRLSDTIIDEWLQLEEKLAALGPSGGSIGAPSAMSGPAWSGDEGWPGAIAASAAAETTATVDKQSGVPAQTGGTDEPALHDGYGEAGDCMFKGQGYFKLRMYREASHYFEQAVHESPDSNLARMFLAMTYMHLRDWDEAQRHFLLLMGLTDHPKWQALGLNALGCIQAAHANLEQAERYFRQAYEADPSFAGPMNNLNNCRTTTGQLTLYFGGSELCRL